jgi:hypothetical protein
MADFMLVDVDFVQAHLTEIAEFFAVPFFQKSDRSLQSALWDSLISLMKEFPNVWTVKGKMNDALLQYLKKACWGNGDVAYPSLLVLLSLIPDEVRLLCWNVVAHGYDRLSWIPICFCSSFGRV